MVRPANCRHNETAGASSGRDKRYMIAAEADGSIRTKKLTTGGHILLLRFVDTSTRVLRGG